MRSVRCGDCLMEKCLTEKFAFYMKLPMNFVRVYITESGDIKYMLYTTAVLNVAFYHIVNIFPVIERYQLKRRQHGPHKIIEISVAMIGIFTRTQTRKV